MSLLIEHIETARRGLYVTAPEVVAVPRIQERFPIFAELLLVVQRRRPCGDGDLLPREAIVAPAARRVGQTIPRIGVCPFPVKGKVPLTALILCVAVTRKEIRRTPCILVIDVDVEIACRQLLTLDCRLSLDIFRVNAHAPLLVFAESLTDIKRLAERTARIDRLLVGHALLTVLRLLRHEVHRAARRLRVCRTVDANRGSRDHLDALHEVRGHIRLREKPRHTVHLELIRVHLEAADRVVVVHRARARAHRRRHKQCIRQRIRAVIVLRKCLLRNVRLTERDIHHILRSEESRAACTAHKAVFLLLHRSSAHALHLDRRELIGIHTLRLLCGTCRAHPYRADGRKCDRESQLSFRHVHFLLDSFLTG